MCLWHSSLTRKAGKVSNTASALQATLTEQSCMGAGRTWSESSQQKEEHQHFLGCLTRKPLKELTCIKEAHSFAI